MPMHNPGVVAWPVDCVGQPCLCRHILWTVKDYHNNSAPFLSPKAFYPECWPYFMAHLAVRCFSPQL